MRSDILQNIESIYEQCDDMTVATVRPDGAPQAAVVSFVHDGLVLYFATAASSQKATNICHDPRVAITMTQPYATWNDIKGLSIAAIAEEVQDAQHVSDISRLIVKRFPYVALMDSDEVDAIVYFRLRPHHISILDYEKGFGHTDLIAVNEDELTMQSQSVRYQWLMPMKHLPS